MKKRQNFFTKPIKSYYGDEFGTIYEIRIVDIIIGIIIGAGLMFLIELFVDGVPF